MTKTIHCKSKFWNKIYFDRVFQANHKEIRLWIIYINVIYNLL